MQALPPTGLAGLPDRSTLLYDTGEGSASPTRFAVDKSTRFGSSFSLVSDTSRINALVNSTITLEAPCSYHNSDTPHADHRQPGQPNHQSETKRRSREPGEAVRRRAAEGREQSAQRKIARTDRRAPRGGRTRSSDQQRGLALDLEGRAHWVTEGNPSEGGCCRGLRCCSRWSA